MSQVLLLFLPFSNNPSFTTITNMGRFTGFWEIFKVAAIVFISALIIRTVLVQPFIVEGSSMEPDFHNGEYLLIEKIGYRFKEPERGDVVVFKYPNNPKINYIKRIIGLPGETIRVTGGKVYITTGFLNFLENEAELAAVLAHELGQLQFHMKDPRKWNIIRQVIIIGATVGSLFLGPFAPLAMIGGQTVVSISKLGKAKADRAIPADEKALAYLLEANYDPQSAINILEQGSGDIHIA